MKYKDFNIRINSKRGDGYDVSVESPAGNASEHITLPFDVADIANQIGRIRGTVRSSATREAVYESEDSIPPTEFGAKLYDSLFSGNIGAMYNRSEGMVSADPDPETGLRIKLRLNLDDPDVSELAQIPWEFVYSAEGMTYLNLSRKTPVVRYIEVPRPPSAHALQGKLRVLVVISSPKGVPELDLDKERKLIEDSWADEDDVDVYFLEHPTKDTLLDKIRDDRFHVLHFMGHGAYDPNTGTGALVLEDDNGNQDMLDAETFGTWLQDAPRMRLAFLNACDTAKTDGDAPFAGVANRLVMAGLPAVIAMQFPISDEAAIDFARTFYKRIVAGFPVDEATAQGRKAIMAGKTGTMEWGTPVLYMRAPDGQLFDAKIAPPVQAVQTDTEQIKPVTVQTGSKMSPVIGAIAAGVIAVLIAGWYVISTMFGDVNFVYSPDPVEVTVGGEATVRFTLDKEDVTTLDLNGYPKIMTVSKGAALIAVSEYIQVSEDEQIAWQATIKGMDDGVATISGAVVLYEGEPPVSFTVEVNVTIDEDIESEITKAIAEISESNVNTVDAINRLNSIDLTKTGSAIEKEIVGHVEDLQKVLDLRATADQLLADPAATLSAKIAALKAWNDEFESVRYPFTAENTDPLVEQMTTLGARPNIDDIILCGSYDGCDTSVTTLSAGSNIYVSVRPAVENLSCEITGPETKDCYFGNRWRTLNSAGVYVITIANSDGDLLGSKEITTH